MKDARVSDLRLVLNRRANARWETEQERIAEAAVTVEPVGIVITNMGE